MTREQKNTILHEMLDKFRTKQWFRGSRFEGPPDRLEETLVIGINYHPAMEMQSIREITQKYNVPFEFKNFSNVD